MSQKRQRRAAFTLVELLAAMAVLSLMLLMFANIFASSGKAWTSGTRRTEQNMNGRAVLEFMSKEIAQSIMNTNSVVFQVDYDTGGAFSERSYNQANSALHFVAARGCNAENTPDEARLIHYYVRRDPVGTSDGFRPYQLMRGQCTDRSAINQAYQSTTRAWVAQKTGAGWSSSIFVDNITQFYVVAYRRGTSYANYRSYTPANQHLPEYVDIVIGLLSEDDARKASFLPPAMQTNYTAKVEKRFTRRVYLPNRTGYIPVP